VYGIYLLLFEDSIIVYLADLGSIDYINTSTLFISCFEC
jgi:hypothetical protein